MAKAAFPRLFIIISLLIAEIGFGSTCGFTDSSYPIVQINGLTLRDVPEDEALWLQDRSYLKDDEREVELVEALALQDSHWTEKNNNGELSRLEEDKILAAYLVKKAIREFSQQASAAERALAQLKLRKGVTQKEIAKLKSKLGFFTVKYALWPNVKFRDFEKDRAVLRETLSSLHEKLGSAPKK